MTQTDTKNTTKNAKIMVPIRQLEVYQLDDGRRIEVFRRCGEVPFITRKDEEKPAEPPNFSNSEEKIYIGVLYVMMQTGSTGEIKFPIQGVTSLEEAFNKWHDVAEQAAQQYTKDKQERLDKLQNQIVTASPEALQQIDNASGLEDGPGVIIP